MRKWIIGAGVVVVSLALGVGAAYGTSRLIKANAPQIRQAVQSVRGNNTSRNNRFPQSGILPGGGNGEQTSPFRNGQKPGSRPSAAQITLDQAVQSVQTYAADLGANFQVAQVMQFQNGFYAVITEKDTGRGALEVLIDPFRGMVLREAGPSLEWNLKYGREKNSSNPAGDNSVTIDQARTAAQSYLDKAHSGAQLNEGGFAFYGYYTFDYSVDGKTAGVVSVNGTTQQVWEPMGLGALVTEKEWSQ